MTTLTMDELQDRTTLKVEELASVLGCSRGTAYAMVRRGEVPTIRTGRNIRIPAQPVRDLLGLTRQGR